MNTRLTSKLGTLLGCGLFALAGLNSAHAALVTVSGATVDFTWDSDDVGMFGDPTVTGDQIAFNPDQNLFKALSTGGTVIISDTVSITVKAHGNRRFKSVSLEETGKYLHHGTTPSWIPDVSVSGEMRVQDMTINPLTMVSDLITSSSDFSTTNSEQPWAASASVDLTGSAWDGVNTISLELSDILSAAAATGSSAWINKDYALVTVSTVPLPPAVLLLLSAIAGLTMIGRRKSIDTPPV